MNAPKGPQAGVRTHDDAMLASDNVNIVGDLPANVTIEYGAPAQTVVLTADQWDLRYDWRSEPPT